MGLHVFGRDETWVRFPTMAFGGENMIDKWLDEIREKYGFANNMFMLTEEELKQIMATYALACLHDKKIADEAFEICEEME